MKNHCYSRLMKGVRQVLFFTSLPFSNPPPPYLHLVLCQTQDRRDLLRGVVLSEGLHDVSIEFVKMMLLGVSHRWCFRNFAKKMVSPFYAHLLSQVHSVVTDVKMPMTILQQWAICMLMFFFFCVCVYNVLFFSSAWTHRFTQLGEILHVQPFSCTCMNTCLCSIFC